MWNCISNYCINSHIGLFISLLIASRGQIFTSEVWASTHKEAMYGLQFATDFRQGGKQVRQAICDGNKMDADNKRPFEGSPIYEKVTGSGIWRRTTPRPKGYTKGNVRITGTQFTGGSPSDA